MDGLQNNPTAASFAAKFEGHFPRAYKEDGSGLVTSFVLQEVHMNVNNQPQCISGTVTVKKNNEGTETETLNVIWNHVGICYSAGKPLLQFDLVKKYFI